MIFKLINGPHHRYYMIDILFVVQLLSRVWFFVTPCTAAHWAFLSFTISQSFLKLMSIELVTPSNRLILCRPLLLLPSIFPSIRVFPVSQLFASGGQRIGASPSASVLPLNIQGWFALGLTSFISLLPKELSRIFSSTTIRKHHFFSTQLSLWSESHIYMWLLEKPEFWLYGSLCAKWYLCFLLCCLGWS